MTTKNKEKLRIPSKIRFWENLHLRENIPTIDVRTGRIHLKLVTDSDGLSTLYAKKLADYYNTYESDFIPYAQEIKLPVKGNFCNLVLDNKWHRRRHRHHSEPTQKVCSHAVLLWSDDDWSYNNLFNIYGSLHRYGVMPLALRTAGACGLDGFHKFYVNSINVCASRLIRSPDKMEWVNALDHTFTVYSEGCRGLGISMNLSELDLSPFNDSVYEKWLVAKLNNKVSAHDTVELPSPELKAIATGLSDQMYNRMCELAKANAPSPYSVG